MKQLLAAFALLFAPNAMASPSCAENPECVLNALWPDEVAQADMKMKPHTVRGLARSFVEAADASGIPGLANAWADRTDVDWRPQDGSLYGMEQARDAMARLSADGILLAVAERRAPWFDSARADVLLAVWQLSEDESLKSRMEAEIRRRAGGYDPSSPWEAAAFGHALAVLGLQKCDVRIVREGAAATEFPDRITYRIFAAHSTGRPLDIDETQSAVSDDPSLIRAAIDAYAQTWRGPTCPRAVRVEAVDDARSR